MIVTLYCCRRPGRQRRPSDRRRPPDHHRRPPEHHHRPPGLRCHQRIEDQADQLVCRASVELFS